MWSGSIEPLDDRVEGTDRDRDPISTTSTPTGSAGVVETTGSVSAVSPVDEWLSSTRWTREDVELVSQVILAAGVVFPMAILAYQQL